MDNKVVGKSKDSYSSYLGNWHIDANPLDRAFSSAQSSTPKVMTRRKNQVNVSPASDSFYGNEWSFYNSEEAPLKVARAPRRLSRSNPEYNSPSKSDNNLSNRVSGLTNPPSFGSPQQTQPINFENSYNPHQYSPQRSPQFSPQYSPVRTASPTCSPTHSPVRPQFSNVQNSAHIAQQQQHHAYSGIFNSSSSQVSEIMPPLYSKKQSTTSCDVHVVSSSPNPLDSYHPSQYNYY